MYCISRKQSYNKLNDKSDIFCPYKDEDENGEDEDGKGEKPSTTGSLGNATVL